GSEVIEPVVVEVAARQRRAHVVSRVRGVLDPGTVLGPELAAAGDETRGRPVEDRDRSRLTHGADVLGPDPHGHVGEAVAVEVARLDRGAERVALLRPVAGRDLVLRPELVVGTAGARVLEPRRGAVDHV